MSSVQDRGSEDGFLGGRLLIAMPGIGDPRFEHAVVLVCLHTAEHAMGVRINLPAESMTVAGVLERLEIEGAPRDPHRRVLIGGPVDRERGYVLHSDDHAVLGSTMPVAEGLSLTATREILETLTQPYAKPDQWLLALGYAGWGPGQLETELRENVWLTCRAEPSLIFDTDHDTKWERALGSMGISPALLSSQSGRA